MGHHLPRTGLGHKERDKARCPRFTRLWAAAGVLTEAGQLAATASCQMRCIVPPTWNTRHAPRPAPPRAQESRWGTLALGLLWSPGHRGTPLPV